VLVVSNIDLTINLPIVAPSKFLESSIKGFTLNINNDYRYLKTGYYVSLHAEVLGNRVIPSSQDAIDAYKTPILLLRAAKAGIPTAPYLVTDSVKHIMLEFGFPVVIFPVNPFSYEGFRIAQNRSALYKAMKSLSMNYKFTVCALPLKGEMLTCKSIFGKTSFGGNVEWLAKKVYDVFKIPICKLHIQRVKSEVYLCGLEPAKKEEIVQEDLKEISRVILQFSGDGENLVG